MNLQIVRRAVLVSVFLSVVMFPVSAQDNPPWPPDPDTLFAPGVEILSVEETESTTETINCGLSSHSNSGWVYYVDDDQVQLCNIDTGETRNLSPLTSEEVGYLPNDFNRAFLSPDKTWLVYARDVAIPGTNGQRVVSSYRLADGHINLLGTIDLLVGLNHPNMRGFRGWLSETRGTLVIDIFGDSVADDYFTYDVTQPDSLKPVGSGFYYYYSAPPRYEVMMTSASLAFATSLDYRVDCTMSLLDADGEYHINLGYDCIGAWALRGGGQYFTLQVEAEDSTTSNLLRFDPYTGEKSVLMTDEIEWLVGVSPDGRYALLLMDDNGQLDLAHEDFMSLYSFNLHYYLSLNAPSRIVVWDNNTRTILHEMTEPDGILPQFRQTWCGDDCLLYAYGCAADYSALPVTLLRFDENQGVTAQTLEASCYDVGLEALILTSPDTRYLFHRLTPERLIEVETGAAYPLFAEGESAVYRVPQAEWLDNETLKIWLRPGDMRQPGEIAYTLRVSAVFDAKIEP